MEKRGDAVIYISTDQISSTSLTTDENGAEISQVRYDPYGAVRWSSGEIPTDKTFTGQRSESFGLMDCNVRYYDPSIMQFQSPDAMIPDQYNVLDWNRYAYARYNPINNTDPTGHWVETALDIAFITYDVYDIKTNGLNWVSGLSLAADVVGVALPIVTGVGLAVRALSHADDVAKVVSATDKVIDAVEIAGKADDIADLVSHGDDLADALFHVDDLPDSTLVCRGGVCGADNFANGSGITINPVMWEASQMIRERKIVCCSPWWIGSRCLPLLFDKVLSRQTRQRTVDRRLFAVGVLTHAEMRPERCPAIRED